jgi:uncharacterized membrane protein YcaP (DUF421 family)
VSLSEGFIALGLLIVLQHVVAVLSTRVRAARRVVKSEPTLLLHERC